MAAEFYGHSAARCTGRVFVPAHDAGGGSRERRRRQSAARMTHHGVNGVPHRVYTACFTH